MIATTCQHEHAKKNGRDRKGNQRFLCQDCGATFAEEKPQPIGNMRIGIEQATRVLGMLLEGLSIRATARLLGMDPGTICDLIITVGGNCQRLLETKVTNVTVKDVAADEIWSFVALKEKHRIARGYSNAVGDSWTFIAIECNTKLILAHHVGQRDGDACWAFLMKMKNAISTERFQMTTDGLGAYTLNVPYAFGMQVDFAQLIKTYESSQEQTRYSPAKIKSTEKLPIFGEPEENRISTSHIERFNLTLRMSNRRHTRLTNAHSKSQKHHIAMQAIFVAFYNFSRKHESLKKQTPAMASGLTDHVWTIKELLEQAAE